MRCATCGAVLNPNSRFCDQCGASATDVEETRIARPQQAAPARYDEDDDIEQVVFTVRPTMLFIKIGYVTAVIGSVLLIVLLNMIKFIDVHLSSGCACAALDSRVLPSEAQHGSLHVDRIKNRN